MFTKNSVTCGFLILAQFKNFYYELGFVETYCSETPFVTYMKPKIFCFNGLN